MKPSYKKGIYCLLIHFLKKRELRIGKLGVFCFPAGFYIYVGSAQNNLDRRIERHLRAEKKLHWHIDYLLKHGSVISVYTYKGNKSAECKLSRIVSKRKDVIVPVKGFGSSDCACESHLYFITEKCAEQRGII